MDKLQQRFRNGPIQKFIGVILEKSIQDNNDGTITVTGKFTSDNRDIQGDTITRDATERALPLYRRWGNVRLMHQPKPVARVLRIGVIDGMGWNEVEIKVIDPDAVFMVKNGLLMALSVGILIMLEDVSWDEETGGLIINDYLLTEISLVDHPANYDASLDTVKIALGMLAQTQGRDAAIKMLEAIRLDLEKSMEENNQEPVEGEQDAPAAEPEAAPAPAPEATPPVEPASENADTESDPTAAEESVPAAEAPVSAIPEPEVAPEPVVENRSAQPVNDLLTAIQLMATELRTLSAAVAEMQSTLKVLAKAPQERAQGEDVGVDTQRPPEAEEPVEDENGAVPVAHKGAVPETELPSAEEAQPIQPQDKSLRAALRKHFKISEV